MTNRLVYLLSYQAIDQKEFKQLLLEINETITSIKNINNLYIIKEYSENEEYYDYNDLLAPIQIDFQTTFKVFILNDSIAPIELEEILTFLSHQEPKIKFLDDYLLYLQIHQPQNTYLKAIYDNFDQLDAEMIITIQTFFDNDLNVLKTSKQLYCHRNTLNYRLDRFNKLTNLDPHHFKTGIIFYNYLVFKHRL